MINFSNKTDSTYLVSIESIRSSGCSFSTKNYLLISTMWIWKNVKYKRWRIFSYILIAHTLSKQKKSTFFVSNCFKKFWNFPGEKIKNMFLNHFSTSFLCINIMSSTGFLGAGKQHFWWVCSFTGSFTIFSEPEMFCFWVLTFPLKTNWSKN